MDEIHPLLKSLMDLIEASPPVKWAHWFLDMEEGDDREAMKAALFDETEHLRSLTDPRVKKSFLIAARTNRDYQAQVLYDTAGDREIPDGEQ